MSPTDDQNLTFEEAMEWWGCRSRTTFYAVCKTLQIEGHPVRPGSRVRRYSIMDLRAARDRHTPRATLQSATPSPRLSSETGEQFLGRIRSVR